MSLLDAIFPKRCLGCGRIGNYFCSFCRKDIRLIRENEAICPVCERLAIGGRTHPGCKGRYVIDGLTSFFRYDTCIKKAVHQIKYRYVFDAAQEFVNLVPLTSYNIIREATVGYEYIFIPIPLHAARLRDRGFNQAQLLGSILAKNLSLGMRIDLLNRIKLTHPQVLMKSRKDRLANMSNVFQVNQLSINSLICKQAGQQLSILLFDDVFTTGATMRSAANALKRAGIKLVWAVTMAR
jgi:competence protein ComFC